MPITQSLVASDVYANRNMASSARAGITYRHSVRLATVLRGSYTSTRQISSNYEPKLLSSALDSTAISSGVAVRYDTSERTQVTAALEWSQTSGVFTDKVLIATLGYGWSGRKWFTTASMGAGVPLEISTADSPASGGIRAPEIVYRGAIGYKFGSQTLLALYSRAAHDEYGHGGRNVVTGFEGNVQSLGGAWSWSAPRNPWFARADLSAVRRPGNFSYIYAWLSTFGIGRQITPSVGLIGELLFDRHGSRAFEGFLLMREGARVTFVWTPRRRPVD
jgi:hypothetical protein